MASWAATRAGGLQNSNGVLGFFIGLLGLTSGSRRRFEGVRWALGGYHASVRGPIHVCTMCGHH